MPRKTYMGASADQYILRLEGNIHYLCQLCGYPEHDRHAIDAIILVEKWIKDRIGGGVKNER